ncbi:MAG TPA: hypothetical protein PL037_02180 [Elusimicrobiales bacterium]|nr:hypothetical protein [Elusimicrobiales bacterium]
MTWEEMGRKYEKEKNCAPLLERETKLEKNWGRLIRSTEKLVWLFAMSASDKRDPSKN